MLKNFIGLRIKQMRERFEMSKSCLGRACGVRGGHACATINHYECGDYLPRICTLEKISKLFEIPACYFYSEEEILSEIIIIYASLDESEKSNLLRYIKKTYCNSR